MPTKFSTGQRVTMNLPGHPMVGKVGTLSVHKDGHPAGFDWVFQLDNGMTCFVNESNITAI